MDRRRFLRAGLSLAATSALIDRRRVAAQVAYPIRPIEIIVPFAAGGPTDTIARFLSKGMTDALGQSLVVVNRPGAGGNIGTHDVARKPHDGYELLLVASSHVINPSVYADPRYDPIADFTPISLVGAGPFVLTVRKELPVHSIADLVALAKERPGKLTYASAGVGTANHLAGELFKQITGVDMLHVPFNGAAPASLALLGGTVDLLFNNMLSGLPMIRADQVRAVAVTGPKHSPALPELPTIMESGVAGFDVQTWYALLAPAGLDTDIRARLNQAVAKALSSPDGKVLLHDQGLEWAPTSPEAVAEFLVSEQRKWSEVVRRSGTKIE